MKKLSLIILLALAVVAGVAQTYPVFNFTATYTFGADGNVTSFKYNGTQYSGISMGYIEKNGVTSVYSNGNFRASGWLSGMSDANKYISFTINAVQGYKFTVNTITFGIGRDLDGTRKTEWYGSGDNYAWSLEDYTHLARDITQGSSMTDRGILTNPDEDESWTGNILSLANDNSYKNVTSCGFRMYMYAADSASGTAGLDGPLTITGTYTFTGTYRAVNVSPTSLTGFTYEYGSGPSPAQTITVSAAKLESGHSVQFDPPNGYGLSLTENGTYQPGTFSVLADSDGYLAPTPVYVRLLSGLAVGDYNGNMYVGYYYYSPPAENVVALSGEVTDGTLPVELSHFSATMTAQNYVQLTWVTQTETNLMGYNVYRNDSDDLSSAAKISDLIAGTNTSQAQTYVYYDMELDQDGTYYYWLQNVDMDGTMGYHGPASVFFTVGGNGGAPAIPKFTRLENAYPNPFNPDTTIRYQLNNAGHVKIDIYNIKGQIVRSFERNHADAGHYGLVWDGCDSSGKTLPSGVYHYRMTCGRYSETKKMVLQK
jgi:hypothetical protein